MRLYPYQDEGAQFLADRPRALLADVMGLGKSAQAIRAADRVNAETILVLCPAAVVDTWEAQFWRWSPFNRPLTCLRSGHTPIPGTGVIVCSYDLAISRRVRGRLLGRSFDVLIADECHQLKNHPRVRTNLVYGKTCDGGDGLAARVKHLWCLSGTPGQNPAHFWPMLHAFGVTNLPYGRFIDRYCKGFEGNYGFQITGAKNVSEFKQLLRPIMRRRKVENVELQLPPLVVLDRPVNPSKVPMGFFAEHGWINNEQLAHDELKRQADLVWEVLQHTEGERSAKALGPTEAAVATLRRYVGLSKATPAAHLVEDVLKEVNNKVVVFGHHRDVLLCMSAILREHGPIVYRGGMTPKRRSESIRRFLKDKRRRVLLANISAAGTGLDGLQDVASTVVLAEPSWSPDANAQAIMRVHRGGQKRPVRAFFVTAVHTIDEAVNRVLRRKTEMIASLYD